jgi:hypothetical protein
MIIRVSLVIQSMLNDAMIEVHHSQVMNEAQERLRFVKYLVARFPNTKEEIDIDSVYEDFILIKEEKQRAAIY